MEQYHGTNRATAANISRGQIDVASGGGELGQGFYSGDLSHEAHNWAWHKYKRDKAVVKFIVDDDAFLGLNPLCLDRTETVYYRNQIKSLGETRTFHFLRNVVWAPVVGKPIERFDQFKYETQNASAYLGSGAVTKTVQ